MRGEEEEEEEEEGQQPISVALELTLSPCVSVCQVEDKLLSRGSLVTCAD